MKVNKEKSIHIDLTEEEIKDLFLAVEEGNMNYMDAFDSLMLFQSKNKISKEKNLICSSNEKYK